MVLHDVLVVLVVLANVKVSIPKEMKKRERERKEGRAKPYRDSHQHAINVPLSVASLQLSKPIAINNDYQCYKVVALNDNIPFFGTAEKWSFMTESQRMVTFHFTTSTKLT